MLSSFCELKEMEGKQCTIYTGVTIRDKLSTHIPLISAGSVIENEYAHFGLVFNGQFSLSDKLSNHISRQNDGILSHMGNIF